MAPVGGLVPSLNRNLSCIYYTGLPWGAGDERSEEPGVDR